LDRPRNEDENDVVVFDDQALEQANRSEGASDQLGSFEALGAEALFDRVLYDGGEFGTGGAIGSEDELDFIGIPGLLEPEQVHELLRTQLAK
ncbi:ATP-dependent helicase, partial [Burkholderia multivorans]